MSLRARLLLAAGFVTLLALVIADVVTYQQLRSFLYDRVDQSLDQAHLAIERALEGPPASFPGGHGPALPGTTGGVGAGAGAAAAAAAVDEGAGEGETREAREADASGGASTTTAPACGSVPGLATATTELPPGSYMEVRGPSGAVLCRSVQPQLGTTAAAPVLPARISGFRANGAGEVGEPTVYFTASTRDGSASYRVRASELDAGPLDGGQLILAQSLGSTESTLDRLLVVELAVTGAALLAALLAGWWVVRIGLRPLRAVETTAEAISRGELAQRVPGDDAKTEVGHLAHALNVMLARIEAAFAQRDATEEELRASEARMRQFVADASHELRTPLTAVSAYAELFEQGASAKQDDLERVMVGIRHETGRMGHLVEDLLLLARLDEGVPLEHEPVELVEMAAEAVRTATTVGPQWPTRLVASRPVEVVGDRMRLRQVLDNLLANVRTHCPPGTAAVVTVDADDSEAVVTVADNGPGLTRTDAAQVFERFFRADPSRSRRHGGSGLGLSIVASIVAAHGGTATVAPGVGGGTVFTVRLPLASLADDVAAGSSSGQDVSGAASSAEPGGGAASSAEPGGGAASSGEPGGGQASDGEAAGAEGASGDAITATTEDSQHPLI